MPGFPEWRKHLGRGWSHDYAIRIELDPVAGDETDVWLVRPDATFVHFFNLEGGSGSRRYLTVGPSDEKDELFFDDTTGGWALRERNGTVHEFNAVGRWTSSIDRNGNAKNATYNGAGQLISVTHPDGRSESFSYHGSGKLSSITEIGVGVQSCSNPPIDCRTWTYSWAGDTLQEILRPDGTKWIFDYQDGRFPGYLTQMALQATSGTRRAQAQWAYDAAGRVAKIWRGTYVSDPSSPPNTDANSIDVWQFAYSNFDGSGRPTTITTTDPLGVVSTTTLGYDTTSNKPRIEAVSGSCPTCAIGPNSVLEYEDSNHPLRPTRIIDGRGVWTDFVWAGNGNLEQRIDGANDPFGDPTLPRTTEWSWDVDYPEFPTSIVGPFTGMSSNRFVAMNYDPDTGDLLSRTASGTEATYPGGVFSLLTEYSDFNGAGGVGTVDPPGYGNLDEVTRTFDVPGRNGLLVSSETLPLSGTSLFGYDLFNRQSALTDANGIVANKEYDALGRVIRSIQRGPDDFVESDDLITRYFYDGFGDLACVAFPGGNGIRYVFESAPLSSRVREVHRGTLTASPSATNCLNISAATPAERIVYALDKIGNRTNEKFYRSSGAGWNATIDYEVTRTYSTRCHVDRVTEAPGVAGVESVTDYEYDCAGNLEKVWDPLHPKASFPTQPSTLYAYDAIGRVTSISQPWGGSGGGNSTTHYQYDVQDHRIEVADAAGTVTTYSYSDRDLETSEVSEVTGTTTFAYNDHGELISRTDSRGVMTVLAVDAADRVTLVDYSDPLLDTVHSYGSTPGSFNVGRLIGISRDGHSVSYSYDRWGRILSDGALSYLYDSNGNRTQITYPGVFRATYTFDFADRHASLSIREPFGSPFGIVNNGPNAYYAFGPAANILLNNNTKETRTHNRRFSPSSALLSNISPATNLFNWIFTINKIGNVTQIQRTVPAPTQTRTFGYQDWQYFLTSASGPWGGPLSWSYDKVGNRLTETRAGISDTYLYQANAAATGNTSILDSIALGTMGTRDYAFGPAGHLEMVSAGANVVDFTNDDAGQLSNIYRPAGETSVVNKYDGRGFLRRIEQFWQGEPTGGEADVTYDSSGRLMSLYRTPGAEESAQRIHYLYFAGRPIAEWKKIGTDPSTVRWLFTDHLGTVIAVTDQAGAITWREGFEPFGADTIGQPSSASKNELFLRLPGQWTDPLTDDAMLGAGSYYNVHRWYEPQTGRYARVDPLGPFGSRHPYVYTRNRPLRYTDRLGLRECGEAPIGSAGEDCLEFCQAQKEYAECQLEKQLEGIHLAGAGLASLAGVTAGFETGSPLVGCLVGGGVFLIDLGIHYAWESFGGGAIELTDNKCRQNCCGGNKPADGESAGPGGGVCPGT